MNTAIQKSGYSQVKVSNADEATTGDSFATRNETIRSYMNHHTEGCIANHITKLKKKDAEMTWK